MSASFSFLFSLARGKKQGNARRVAVCENSDRTLPIVCNADDVANAYVNVSGIYICYQP